MKHKDKFEKLAELSEEIEELASLGSLISLTRQSLALIDYLDLDKSEIWSYYIDLKHFDPHEASDRPEVLAKLAGQISGEIMALLFSCQDYWQEEVNLPTNKDSPTFELGENEKERIFKLSGQMRKIVSGSHVFDAPHRIRLLKRISAIEIEVEKAQGNLDVILAGAVDVGDALGTFGEQIKPLTDRIREIVGIAKSGSREYDKLPKPDEATKQLPKPEDTEEGDN